MNYEYEIWMAGCFGTEYTSEKDGKETFSEIDVNDVLLDVVYAESLDDAFQQGIARYGKEAEANLYVLDRCVSARTQDGRNIRLRLWTDGENIGYDWTGLYASVDPFPAQGRLWTGKNGAEAEVKALSPEALELAYRVQQKKYRMEDAENHFNELCENGWLEEYGILPGSVLTREDAEIIAERFLEHHDCNLPENDQFEAQVKAYFAEKSKEDHHASDR